MARPKPRPPTTPKQPTPGSFASSQSAPLRAFAPDTWKTVAAGLLIVASLFAVWWYAVRPPQLVRQAEAILERDPVQAAELLENAVASSWGEYRDAEVLWARALVRAGRWEEALGCWSEIQSPELGNSRGLLALADDAAAADVPLLAVLSLKAISPHDPLRSVAIERLISLKQQVGDNVAAMGLAEELAQLKPANPIPWLMKARLREQAAALPEAAADYREFLSREKDPARRAEGLRSITRLLTALGERQEARTRLDELSRSLVTLRPEDHLQEAQLRRLEGDIKGAWTEVELVLASESSNLTALELRGTLAMDRGDYAAAVIDLQSVINQQPWNQGSQYKLSQALTKAGRGDEASGHLTESRRLHKLSLRILELRAQGDLTATEIDELAQALEQTGLKSAAERLRRNPAR